MEDPARQHCLPSNSLPSWPTGLQLGSLHSITQLGGGGAPRRDYISKELQELARMSQQQEAAQDRTLRVLDQKHQNIKVVREEFTDL